MRPGSAAMVPLGAVAIAVYLFMLTPVLIIVVMAFDPADTASFPPSGWSLRWFAELAHDRGLLDALRTSLGLGLVSSFISTVIGTAAAYAIARFRFAGREFVQMLLTFPVLVPHIILGVGLLLTFRLVGLASSFGLLVVGHVSFTLPFVLLTTMHRLQSIPPSYEEAARTLGANHLQTFREVTFPLVLPAIAAGMLFAFTMSFDEVTATLFWIPANVDTVQTKILGMLQFSILPTVNALGAVLVLISVALPLGAMLAARRIAPPVDRRPPRRAEVVAPEARA